MTQLSAIFAFNRGGVKVGRGIGVVCILVIPLVVLGLIGKDAYWLSASFGALFVGLGDPGGPYLVRLREMAWVGIAGALLTALGFAIGGGPWGWVALAAFVVTLATGLAMKYGLHRMTSALRHQPGPVPSQPPDRPSCVL